MSEARVNPAFQPRPQSKLASRLSDAFAVTCGIMLVAAFIAIGVILFVTDDHTIPPNHNPNGVVNCTPSGFLGASECQ